MDYSGRPAVIPRIKMEAEEGSQREIGLPEDAERDARWMTLKVRKETPG